MEQYLIDNNAISAYFSDLLSDIAMQFMAEVIDQVPVISVITEIEALSWIHVDKNKERIVQEFIEDAAIITISPDIVKQSVRIRRSRKIKTPDAIIAATAIVHNLALITNDSDFNNIEGLKVINPYSL